MILMYKNFAYTNGNTNIYRYSDIPIHRYTNTSFGNSFYWRASIMLYTVNDYNYVRKLFMRFKIFLYSDICYYLALPLKHLQSFMYK